MTFKDIPLESSSRKFWKDLNSAENFSTFINLHRNTSLQQLTRSSSIEWPTSLKNFNILDDTPTMTTFIQRNKKAFKTKILAEELPTLNKLIIQRSDLYANWCCVTCNSVNENLHHLWTCSANHDIVVDLQHSLCNFLDQLIVDKLGKNSSRHSLFKLLQSRLHNCFDFQSDYNSFTL